ncbi:MAG: hypothetical protein AB7G28_26065 [Pirellulales bacterium]
MASRISLATFFSLATLFSLVASHAAAAEPVTLDFDNLSRGLIAIPYTEDGFTVTAPSRGNGAGICRGSDDGYLCGGTNTIPIRFRITGETPFDLVSLDVEQVFRSWRIEASSGAILSLGSQTGTQSPGTIDFEALPGWRGLSYFEIVHDPGQANGFINADNISLLPVPEPSTLALATALATITTNCRRQRNRPTSTN